MPDETSAIPDPPEYYIDTFQVGISAYSVILDFGLRTSPEETRQVARIRMSPEHAKVMAILFRRAIKEFEQTANHTIAIPPALLQDKTLSLEQDWW